jgi:hypothetical protein
MNETAEAEELTIDKSLAEQDNDYIRTLYAKAFALENGFETFIHQGSVRSTYVRDKDGNFQLHSNGTSRRMTALACKFGMVIWLIESIELDYYKVEVKDILGEIQQTFEFKQSELDAIFSKHRSKICYQEVLNDYGAKVKNLSREKLAEEHQAIVANLEKELSELDEAQLSAMRLIVEESLSKLLSGLIEEAFEEKGNVGRRIYLKILEEDYKNQKLTTPLYLVAKNCVKYGLTFISKIKEMTLNEISPGDSLPPEHELYKQWLQKSAKVSKMLISELAKDKKAPPTSAIPLPKILGRL